MKTALVQLASPDAESAADRLTRVSTLVRELDEPVDLVVLPELWGVGYGHFDQYPSCAEDFDGPTTTAFAQIAADRGCYIHAGSFVETTPGGTLRNTAVLLGPDGQVLHRYSKIHVFGYQSLETELLTPGESVSTVQTPFGPVSGTTCYDLRFPALWTQIVETGAQIVIVPAAWPAARKDHWRLLTAARALDNQVYVIAVNATGSHGGTQFGGNSRIVDPWGQVVAEAGDNEGIIIADIDTALVDQTRTEFPVLADRLDDYSQLTERTTRA